ncbi:MAG: polymer-forming cytoskeletal protein [Anaerolineales bacterium]|nr:polymer-forming cytoskeletal protein [Anaerolineales bacterium]
MNTKYFYRIIILALVLLMTFSIATPALAFDPRGGDSIVIDADEVIEDDLYLTANMITINGVVKGDVIAFANSITLNGKIEGDFMAAGNSVTVNGEVTDDLRCAGYVLGLGPQSKIGDDVVAAGYSLEVAQGSAVGGALVLAAYQGLLNGQVSEGAKLGLGKLELNGVIDGDVQLAIGDPEDSRDFPTFYMGNNMPPVPSVKPGLNFGSEAQINGKLDYTSTNQYSFPAGVITGSVTYTEPPVSPEDISQYRPMRETNPVLHSILEALRFLVALVVIGLLVAWLVPAWIRRPAEMIQKRPLPSLGWGFLTFFGFFFVLGLLGMLVLALIITFAALTLGNLAGLSLALGGSAFFALVIAFGLIAGYLSYLVVGYLSGRWILQRINPALNEKPYWALLLGLLILVVLTAIPFLGGLVRVVVILIGLGAVAILIWEHFRPTPAANTPATALVE